MINRLKNQIDELVNEILDHIPEKMFQRSDTTFLDIAMGGGQFVRTIEQKLLSYGHSKENVSKRVFGFESNELTVQYAVNHHNLLGTYKAISDKKLLETTQKRKYDVVVGNPQHQNTNPNASSGKLWPRFIKKSIALTKSKGYTAIVSPNSWTKGSISQKGSGKLWEELRQYNVVYVNNKDCGVHFKESTVFSYFILSKTKPKMGGILRQDGEEYTVPFHQIDMIPADPEAIFIVNSFFKTEPKIDCTLVTNTRNKDMNVQESGMYPVFTNGKILYTDDAIYDTEEKILIPWSNTYEKHIQVGNHIAGDNTVYLYTHGYGENIMSVLTSRLYLFCLKQMKMAAHNEPVRLFPALDFTRKWSDAEIYEYFNLNEKEVEYVDKHFPP